MKKCIPAKTRMKLRWFDLFAVIQKMFLPLKSATSIEALVGFTPRSPTQHQSCTRVLEDNPLAIGVGHCLEGQHG